MPLKPKPNLLIIVDDSSFDLKINSRIAIHAGLFKQILCFSSAEATLDFLIENISNDTIYPHLILLDIQMPEMDGFEFMERFEKFPENFKRHSKIIMLSSTDDLSDIARAEANKSIIKLLKKPLLVKELKLAVDKYYDIV